MKAGFRSVTKWMPWALAVALLAAETALCQAQSSGDSTVVPYRAGRPESPPPTGDVPKSYGPVEAGQDAYQQAEQERREAISRQLQTEDAVAYDHAPPAYYGPGMPGGAVQVWAGRRGYHYVYRPPYLYPRSVPPGWLESWPLAGREIYPYPYVYRVPQPLGHQVVVIGPRSSLVRPIYPAPPVVGPPPSATPSPSSSDRPQPALPRPTPSASGGPERIPTPSAIEPAPVPPPPPAPSAGGAREF